RSGDYPRYLSIKRRMEGGEVLGPTEIDELEQIAGSSPGLAEASLFAASAARILPDRPRAVRILRAFAARHPDDPRLAYERFLLELETGSIGDAQSALADLERRAPGDVRLLRAKGLLLSRQGRFAEAAEVGRRMAPERPSGRNLWYVVRLEIDLADAKSARQHLDQLLQISPGNAQGLAEMAELEWLMGDPAKAARIYEGLLKDKFSAQNLGNLGWSL